ncbi:hypothetical protein E3N88_13854 [Mikania micrantha]|uniref:Uncharacterized protein n=1 Tax=Mikania micrantha TaxID=192012 RepID=A0A5N6NZS9_9ASTR|nr:hypothetical protein E3N88_13854 [Mikania micrantha]
MEPCAGISPVLKTVEDMMQPWHKVRCSGGYGNSICFDTDSWLYSVYQTMLHFHCMIMKVFSLRAMCYDENQRLGGARFRGLTSWYQSYSLRDLGYPMPRLKLKMGLNDADCQPRMNGCHELNVMYELRGRCKGRKVVSVMHIEEMGWETFRAYELDKWLLTPDQCH